MEPTTKVEATEHREERADGRARIEAFEVARIHAGWHARCRRCGAARIARGLDDAPGFRALAVWMAEHTQEHRQ